MFMVCQQRETATPEKMASLGSSLYLKVLLAALLHSLYEVDNDQFRGELQFLAWIPPPFGSWATSSPASEDDWLDPADEVVDPESTLPWDAQVGSTARECCLNSQRILKVLDLCCSEVDV